VLVSILPLTLAFVVKGASGRAKTNWDMVNDERKAIHQFLTSASVIIFSLPSHPTSEARSAVACEFHRPRPISSESITHQLREFKYHRRVKVQIKYSTFSATYFKRFIYSLSLDWPLVWKKTMCPLLGRYGSPGLKLARPSIGSVILIFSTVFLG
jgi:hypothetical protein